MIYIYLSTVEDNIGSAAIRYYTNFPFSHVGFYDSEKKAFFSAQMNGGVKYRTLDGKDSDKENFTSVKFLTSPHVEEAYAWALTQAGKPYDKRDILGFVLDHDWRQTDKFICSELVSLSFEKVNDPLLNPSIDVNKITPRDIALSLKVTPVDSPLETK